MSVERSIPLNQNLGLEQVSFTDEDEGKPRGYYWQFNVSNQFPISRTNVENGKATIMCGPPHEGYSLQTVLKNGKPNGESRMLDRDKVRIATLVYVDGVPSGPCKLYDYIGRKFFEGYLFKGYRHGKGKEFDEKRNVSFEGFFKEGKRLNIQRAEELSDYWKETDEDNKVISVCRKNDECKNDGVCYFYTSGKISKVSEWKNGVEASVLKHFNGDKMTEFINGVKRYEGEYLDSLRDGYPRHGNGKEFDEDGLTLIYNGGFSKNKRGGEGLQYKDGDIIYEGTWSGGERDGEGIEFENEEVVYRGRWRSGARYMPVTVERSSDMNGLSEDVTDLTVSSSCCNDMSSFSLNRCNKLVSVEIGDNCFEKVNTFNIDGLSHLKSIKIGKNSFTKAKNNYKSDTSRSFHILNCTALESVEIGDYSFSDYSGQFELKNLPSLSTLKIGIIGSGSQNFYCASFMIENLPNLQSIELGNQAFHDSLSTVISNLPNLKSIKMGADALVGRNNSSCSLLMKDLPELESIVGGSSSSSFKNTYSVTLAEIPNLKTVTLPNKSFEEVKIKSVKNVSHLLSYFGNLLIISDVSEKRLLQKEEPVPQVVDAIPIRVPVPQVVDVIPMRVPAPSPLSPLPEEEERKKGCGCTSF